MNPYCNRGAGLIQLLATPRLSYAESAWLASADDLFSTHDEFSLMANKIKNTGEGAALQITREARSADLAEEATGDDLEGSSRWDRLADVRVFTFEKLILVVDNDQQRLPMPDVAELVSSAAQDTESIYRGSRASIRPAGNGCMVSLPGYKEAGFHIGTTAPVVLAPCVLVIHDGSSQAARLAEDLVSMRREQSG
jgi:hypothetical protein